MTNNDEAIDNLINWSLKRLVELMDSDDVSVEEYNSFVEEYGDFINIALGEESDYDSFMTVTSEQCDS